MYVPASFRESDTVRLQEFIVQNGFGLLTSNGPHGLVASHLPLFLDSTRGPLGTLQGHFAAANEQSLDQDVEVLTVFSGPHAYISPTWYEAPNTVPTWNYVAVHAYGILKRMEDPNEVMRMLQLLVQKYEGSRPDPWPFNSETPFHRKMAEGIVGFEIEITRLEGKWKLNQNHPAERRQRVVAALKAAGGHDQLAVAQLMESTLENPPQ